jgi:hypothetical protein
VARAAENADALYALGQADAAAGKAHPEFADAWLGLGLACYRLGDIGANVTLALLFWWRI